MWSRYTLNVSPKDIKNIISAIRNGVGRIICEQHDDQEVIEIPFKGKEVVVVFCRDSCILKTALPPRGAKSIKRYVQQISQFYGDK